MIISNIQPKADDQYRIFPLRHNWQSAVRESYEFLTDILVSGNGKEQRRAVRTEPRRSLEISCRYVDEEKYELDRFLNRHLGEEILFPEEHNVVYTSAPMAPKALGVGYYNPDQIEHHWLTANRTVILSDGWRKETRTINGASKTTIGFAEENDTPWPIGTKITPAVIGRLRGDPRSSRRSSRAGTISVSFDGSPGKDPYYPDPVETSYIGFRELWTRRPNWASTPEVTHGYERQTVDYGYGVTSVFLPHKFPERATKLEFMAKSHEAAKQMLDFFYRHRGRNREFLMPSFEPDIPYYAIAPGSKSLLIRGTGFALDYKDSTVFRRIVIRPKDGEDIHAQVDYVEALPDTNTSVLWLTEPLPNVNLAPDAVFGASWVLVSRFAADRIDIDWTTNRVAEFAVTTLALENLDV